MERIVQPEDCLNGGGEMGALMRSHDWSRSPLGRVADWPAPLRMAVSICLNSRFPMVIWWEKDLILLYNDAWLPVLGTKHPQSLGRPGRESWPEIWDIIGVQLESVLTTGQATWADDMLLMVDRHGYKEEAYFTYSYSPIHLETGEVGGAFTAVSETTQRVLGERRLQTLRDLAAQTGQAKTAEQASAIAIQTLAANPADIPFALLYLLQADGTKLVLAGSTPLATGTPASPVEVDLTRSDSDETSSWPLATVVRTGNAVLVDDLLNRFGMLPTGVWELQPQQALVLPLKAVGQELPAGLLVAGVNPCRVLDDDYRNFFEMTAGYIATTLANARAYEEERKRAEALAELDRAKTTFFSNVSHEFRTPLTLMLGPLEDILAGEAGTIPDNQQQQLEMVHRNGIRLLKLVNALLDFSRIEAGRVQAVYKPTDLAAFTAELGSVFRSAVERAGLNLVVDCPPLPELIYVDRDMWEKIVLNLLSNAFKFTFSGEIAVRMRFISPGSVELVVQDTGTGIPAEELPRLFERFHRVEGARGRSHEGSGIGLALVNELVRLHGGSIQVESVVGSGTTFTVRVPTGKSHLPADSISASSTLASTALGATPYVEEALRWLPEAPQHSQAEPGNEHSQAGAWEREELLISHSQSPISSKARILLADDNADMRDYLQRLLRERYEVFAVADGIAALADARRQTPDLVLSDVMMPGLDGFGLLKELRAIPETREVPIILLSARAGEESRIEGLEAGADDYLVKPFSARELLARVAANLELARVRREAANIERLARTEAEAAREQVSRILESISDAFLFLDNEWRYTYVNQEAVRQARKKPEELRGKVIWEVFPDLVNGNFYKESHRAVREQVSVAFEEFYPSYNCWYEVHAYPSKDGLSVYFQNITQRKQLEENLKRQAEQLAEANRMKDEFLAIVSHELRSPLNSMLGWTQILRSRNLNPAQTAKALETIERNARSQTQLIEDLLDVSRVITGKLRLNVHLIELAPIVEAAIDSIRPAADAKQIRLQVLLDPFAGPVSGDSERLQQVIWNLLSNAVKFTPKRGRVYVLLQRINSHIEIAVSDTGIGISPEFLPFVFERFRQADATTTRAQGGLGLGLAIVRHLVELHGGTIGVASPGEGQGSTFTVSLPLPPVQLSVNDTERVHPTVSTGVPFDNSPSLEGLRVLVVDDEADTREFLSVVLQECGAEVTAAASAREALETIQQWKPDVLVSDIGMPEEDGYALIRQVRCKDSSRGTILPAAALTAYARSEDRMRALKEGFQMHLSKPVEPAELVTVVASLARTTGKI